MPISEYLKEVRRMVGTHRLLMPGLSAIIVNDRGHVVLHRSADDGKWYVIGGAPDPGEPPALAAVREAYEETGLIVRPERLVGVYADPVVKYSNGDEVLYYAATFLCRPVGGELKIADDESLEVRYFRPDALPDLLPTHRQRLQHARSDHARAYFAWDQA